MRRLAINFTTLLAALLISGCASIRIQAQTITVACPSSVKAGTALTCTASLVNGQGPAGIQYTATSTPALGGLTAVSTGTGANKTIAVSGNSVLQVGAGGILAALNATPIADGVITSLTWQVPVTLGNQNVQISLAGGALPSLATTPAGAPISVAASPSVSVSVLPSTSFCDINGDGQINQADVAAQQTMVMTFPQSTKCARSTSGCNVTAVQIVINAALGQACTATQ